MSTDSILGILKGVRREGDLTNAKMDHFECLRLMYFMESTFFRLSGSNYTRT